jgi:HlyD family secretion protein
MKNFFNKANIYISTHKKMAIFIFLLIALAIYFIYTKTKNNTSEIRYITQIAQKETIISSISGTGQVSASNQIDIKPEVSGIITSINVKAGNYVSAGKILFSLDNSDAQKSIRDAEISLENAKITLEKFKLQNSEDNMNADLSKAYDDGFNTVSNVFLDLPTVMTGLNDMFFKSTINTGQWNIDWYQAQISSYNSKDRDQALIYKEEVANAYEKAKISYEGNLNKYKSTSRNSSKEEIENLILNTYETVKVISDTVKISNNYVDFINDVINNNNAETPQIITTHKASLSNYTSKTNTHLLNLLSIKTSIKNYKDAFPSTDLDLQASLLSLKQKENALADIKENLYKYNVTAPFGGVIASVAVQKGESASSGTVLATIITSKKLATISLNEVDVAKIKLGQKSTLVFDAISDLSISGRVEEIDSIGTVSQGVVTYNVKISFDTSDERIKSGMSVSANIITNVKQNVIAVPNSSIKTKNEESYVEIFETALPEAQPGVQGSVSLILPTKRTVEIGISNDTSTEIISGIKENDIVVTKTINSSSTSTATSTKSILSGMGGSKTGGAPRD